MKCYIGDITEVKADVIVNAADTSFTPGGGLARWIEQQGGTEIFEEARKKYTDVRVGGIYPTTAGTLNAEQIYHIPTVDWDKNHKITLVELHSVVVKALEQLHTDGYKSIVFPLLGAGTLKLPSSDVAKEISDAIAHMEEENPDLAAGICVLTEDDFEDIQSILPKDINIIRI